MSLAEEQRRQIEQLMGREQIRHFHQKDPDLLSPKVCKPFLINICPHDLLSNTKLNIGKCPNLHLTKHKIEYESKLKKNDTKFIKQIDLEILKSLKKFINEIDHTIYIAEKRLEHTPEEKAKIANFTKELDDLDIEIGLMLQELEYLFKKDQINKLLQYSIELNSKLLDRNIKQEQIRKLIENIGQSSQQKLQVCDVCGAYLSRLDNDRRLADHFVGKIHLGYVQLRQAYNELKSKYK
ncbi:unnamed protein product [Candida verbasci]|uniref:Uncharacterized protein n=1 Tax=Candida verbasci TaxID=1227364 RepID=A0A9W4TYY8_9ASCO|nr:unnamed protein product [Candida verbasci]